MPAKIAYLHNISWLAKDYSRYEFGNKPFNMHLHAIRESSFCLFRTLQKRKKLVQTINVVINKYRNNVLR